MQLLCYLTIYDIPIPANSEIYVTQFTKLIEFDVLNPEGVIQLVDPDFNLHELISGNLTNVIDPD